MGDYAQPTQPPVTVPNGGTASGSIQLGGRDSPFVPTSIKVPADIGAATTVKFQVSDTSPSGITDANKTWYDIDDLAGNVYPALPLTVSRVIAVPDVVQQACVGFAYLRLVVDQNPTKAIIFGVTIAAVAEDSALVPSPPQAATVLGTVNIKPSTGSLTDRSGTIAAGGVSQNPIAANASRKYLLIQNQDAAEDLWFTFGIAAVLDQPSIRLGPKQAFTMEDNYISTQAVNVNATTTGHKFTAKEG